MEDCSFWQVCEQSISRDLYSIYYKIEDDNINYSISINFNNIKIRLHAIEPLLLKGIPDLNLLLHALDLLQLLHGQIDPHFKILHLLHVDSRLATFVMHDRDVKDRLVLKGDIVFVFQRGSIQQVFHFRQEIIRGGQFYVRRTDFF